MTKGHLVTTAKKIKTILICPSKNLSCCVKSPCKYCKQYMSYSPDSGDFVDQFMEDNKELMDDLQKLEELEKYIDKKPE